VIGTFDDGFFVLRTWKKLGCRQRVIATHFLAKTAMGSSIFHGDALLSGVCGIDFWRQSESLTTKWTD
jgi:hypothetical protein